MAACVKLVGPPSPPPQTAVHTPVMLSQCLLHDMVLPTRCKYRRMYVVASTPLPLDTPARQSEGSCNGSSL